MIFYVCIPTINGEINGEPFLTLDLTFLKYTREELTIYCIGFDNRNMENFIYEVDK